MRLGDAIPITPQRRLSDSEAASDVVGQCLQVANGPRSMVDSSLLSPRELQAHATAIVVAYLSMNKADRGDVSALVGETYSALMKPFVGEPTNERAITSAPRDFDDEHVAVLGKPEPAKAQHHHRDEGSKHLTCLEDGKQFRSLRRHLWEKHGLTPEAYRIKWDLPSDYPLVASDLSESRSKAALSTGFGRVNASRRSKPRAKSGSGVSTKR